MFRTTLSRTIALVVLLAGVVTGGALAATTSGVTIGPSTVLVNPNGYRFAIKVTCPASAEATPCTGVLSIRTVPIKPYSSIARKRWNVGALPFSVPAGTTGSSARGWLRAGALVQAKLTGRVQIVVKIMNGSTVVGTRTLTLKLNHDW